MLEFIWLYYIWFCLDVWEIFERKKPLRLGLRLTFSHCIWLWRGGGRSVAAFDELAQSTGGTLHLWAIRWYIWYCPALGFGDLKSDFQLWSAWILQAASTSKHQASGGHYMIYIYILYIYTDIYIYILYICVRITSNNRLSFWLIVPVLWLKWCLRVSRFAASAVQAGVLRVIPGATSARARRRWAKLLKPGFTLRHIGSWLRRSWSKLRDRWGRWSL